MHFARCILPADIYSSFILFYCLYSPIFRCQAHLRKKKKKRIKKCDDVCIALYDFATALRCKPVGPSYRRTCCIFNYSQIVDWKKRHICILAIGTIWLTRYAMHFVFLAGSYIRSHNWCEWITSVTCNVTVERVLLSHLQSLLTAYILTHQFTNTFVCVRRPTINSRLVFCNDLKIHSCPTTQIDTTQCMSAVIFRNIFSCDVSALWLHVPTLNGICAFVHCCIHVRQIEFLRCISIVYFRAICEIS